MVEFIIAVSGSRTISDRDRIYSILDEESCYYICQGYTLQFRLGDAIGVDHIALQWCRERGLPRTIFFADKRGFETWEQSAALWQSMDDRGPIERTISGELEAAVLASDWDNPSDGKMAGPIRNAAMIGGPTQGRPKADLLIAIWDGISPGTRNCMASARNANVFIHQWGGTAPIEFRTPLPQDAELVECRGPLDAPEAI